MLVNLLLVDQPDRTLLKATSGNDALRVLLTHDVALGTRLVPII